MPDQPHQLDPVPEAFRHLVPDHGKSPWQPSRTATARVPDPVPAPVTCPDCQGRVQIAHHTQIYRSGKAYSDWPWAYRCTSCDAMVGMHPFTAIPLGTLAGAELRNMRATCKQPFNLLWQHNRMSRIDAYQALADHLGIPKAECHFGLFDADQCRAARAWAVQQLRATPTD